MLKYLTPSRAKKNAQDPASKDTGSTEGTDQEIGKSQSTEDTKREDAGDQETQDQPSTTAESLAAENTEDEGKARSRATDTNILEQDEPPNPVLKDEDEAFLEQITSDDQAAPPTVQPTIILDDGRKLEGAEALNALRDRAAAQETSNDAATASPINKQKSPNRPKVSDFPSQAEAEAATTTGTQPDPNPATDGQDQTADEKKKTSNYWAYIPSMPTVQLPNVSTSAMFPDRSRERMANTLQSAAEAFKAGEGVPLNPDGSINQEEATKQQAHDLSNMLAKLNLSAINNRVFSLSAESQDLLERFNLVLRDLITGGPTAYHDLETLLDERGKQLGHMWSQLPPFVQTLVKSLPAKIGSSFGPELFAAAAESPDAKMSASSTSAAGGKTTSEVMAPGNEKKKRTTKGSKMPSVKNLVTEKGAVAQMLRSILNFLRARFPAFMSGTNVLMSLAVFILLFVFWYCHKRGRETRLASSSLENSVASLDTEKGSPSTPSSPELSASGEADEAGTPMPADDKIDPAAEAQIDAAVAEAKQEKPLDADKELQAVLEQPDPKEVDLPESPGETRASVGDVSAAAGDK
ncbi:MAG: hypothetical protein M1821_009482 [Bathelium mastoideum]|nr:MAG: hypothetical protein M1821_009482 [Bathelium mastoideum]